MLPQNLQGCGENVHGWLQVCSCNQNNCNTYKYFRTKVDSKAKPGSRQFDKDPMAVGGYDLPKDGNSMTGSTFSNSNLVILLVCVPLGIGALAVVFVFVNYHCKLC